MDGPAVAVALVLMLLAVGAKIAAGQHIQSMKNNITQVERDRGRLLKQLQGAAAQRKTAEHNLAAQEKKKTKLKRKISAYGKKISTLEQENKKRAAVTQEARRKIIRAG